MPPRTVYTGTQRKLVLAFDVGTTYSGISYTILDPDREPEIRPVTRFPGRAKTGGDAKVPTVIYYGPDGIPHAVGAETEQEGIEGLASDVQWVKAEWFKLHLRPKTRTTASVSEEIPPLPAGKTAVDLFADFLRYLYRCARSYIQETHMDGRSLLDSASAEFILSHPNAWEGAQQTLMRKAAVQAGLIMDTPRDHARISFISEGEASLNFCIDKGMMTDSIRGSDAVTIVDAGGGTVDVSTYARKWASNDEYEEIVAAQCYFKGSIFVTRAAGKYLDAYLLGSRFHEDVPSMTEKFDKTTKLSFRDPSDPQYVKFGTARDKDPSLGIRAGQLKLDGTVIADFFEPSVQCIVEAVLEQRALAPKAISTVFLVGGFAASDYLYTQLRQRLQLRGFDVRRADAHLMRNKAVPDGAVAGYLRPYVRTRVAKYTLGVRCCTPYNPFDPEHIKRSLNAFCSMSGNLILPKAFSTILAKDTLVSDTQEFRASFYDECSSKSGLVMENSTTITCYRGTAISCPDFEDQDAENFYDLFTVRANLSKLINELQPSVGELGNTYFKLCYDIIILFGITEFKAQYAWKENGVEKRGPAEILFDTEIEYRM